ncbi:DUF3577 domain-containing protein, partial [Pseudomonas aeruginosa]|nr:DUF3577 domain-containing protein [Pseudomonas aeruginosa]HEJ5253133.1 DUF3577 domain-containing protein [Pseudomonas aeruginosa]
PDASLKGRLLFISWIKVDGTTVYDAKEEAEKAQQGQGEPQGEPAAPAEHAEQAAA